MKSIISKIQPAFRGAFTLLFILILIFTSCRSNKDLTFMDDADISKLVPRALPNLSYKIKINDNLFVSVISRDPEMNKIYNPATAGNGASNATNNTVWSSIQGQFVFGYVVDKDGFINLPSMGKVRVVGMTIEECQNEIQALATQYLKDVSTKVRLLNFKVTVLGEVAMPGVHYNYNPEYTVLDAISSANGTKNTAVLTNVLVLREIGDQVKTYRINLKSTSAFTSEGFNLVPNDVVIVQPGKNKNLELQTPIFSLVFSSLAIITSILLILTYNRKL
jgi:polysaccharide export outer membrane protein